MKGIENEVTKAITTEIEQVVRTHQDSEEKKWNELEHLLRALDNDKMVLLQRVVAWICDVNVADMLSSSHKSPASQARWLFWNAYRFMTGDTFERISQKTQFDGHRFELRAVANGIEKISKLIERDRLWEQRWIDVKRIIKIINGTQREEKKYKVTLSVPHEIEVQIKKEIQ